MANSVKEMLRHMADELPGNATWEDVIEEVRFRRAVETGVRAADRGDFASKDDLRATFARWNVNIES